LYQILIFDTANTSIGAPAITLSRKVTLSERVNSSRPAFTSSWFVRVKPRVQAFSSCRNVRVRRVVTGHNKNGRSCFVMDGRATNVKRWIRCLVSPSPICGNHRCGGEHRAQCRCGDPARSSRTAGKGTIFRIVEFPPDSPWRNCAGAAKAFESIGAGQDGETLLKPGDIMIQRGTNHSWSARH
jgi:hypothetical protein